ncbi:MAG TPA: membrane protein insertase YidC [Gemmatimonadales bacterium]|nr:membrane protein insertase YidC [Gemmatimonadales bacterium]
MNDRRPLIAIALIMVIAFIPGLLRKPPPVNPADSTTVSAPIDSVTTPPIQRDDSTSLVGQAQPTLADSAPLAPPVAEDTIRVRSGLYEYRISTVGGRIIGSRFLKYESMFAGDATADGKRGPLELIPDGASMLDTRIAMGRDTVRLDAAVFTPSARELDVTEGPATLVLTGTVRGQPAELRYTFHPDEYQIDMQGTIGGVPSTGATLLIGLGNGFRNTEKNPAENHRESGVVTDHDGTTLTRYRSLEPQQTEVQTGPFDWVAVKSKYFVGGLFVVDSSGTAGISAMTVRAEDIEPKSPERAVTRVTMPLPTTGTWNTRLYLGPMEYDRLSAIGHNFDDVNPYGWKGLRTIIRPFAVAIRGAFVWMHTALGLHYGFAIIFFGVFIRMLLWPLNHKAMRSMTEMQAIQPEMQELQAKYKEQPEKLQAEMLKLYREHKVNPLSGCWPMLLPYPFLVAVFFVLQSTIELRGVSFLWMPDLSLPDPLYIIPVFMVLSMFALSKLGQMGIPPNPQAKMMMYVMPAVFGFLFLNFASGLNLYYAVQNIAAAPQQYLISKQRVRILAEKQKKRKT